MNNNITKVKKLQNAFEKKSYSIKYHVFLKTFKVVEVFCRHILIVIFNQTYYKNTYSILMEATCLIPG